MYWEAVPAALTAIVPSEVKGLFATLNATGIDKPTEVNPLTGISSNVIKGFIPSSPSLIKSEVFVTAAGIIGLFFI